MLGKANPISFRGLKSGPGPSQFQSRSVDVPCVDLSLVTSSLSSNLKPVKGKDLSSAGGALNFGDMSHLNITKNNKNSKNNDSNTNSNNDVNKKKPKKSKKKSTPQNEDEANKANFPNAPGFVMHPVSMSDTFMSLSIKYDVTADQIRKANKLSAGTRLCSLFEIKIPQTDSTNDKDEAATVVRPSASSKTPKKTSASASMEEWLADQVKDVVKPETSDTKSAETKMGNKYKSFFDRVDSRMIKFKETANSHQTNTATARGDLYTEPVDLLNGALMSTTQGREIAEDRALSQIERILCMDEDALTRRPTPQPKVESTIRKPVVEPEENDLSRDLDVYGL